MAKNVPKGTRPPKTDRLADGSNAKKYPYSIRATVRSIREYWFREGASASTVGDFASDLDSVFQALQNKYRGHGNRKAKGLVNRVEGGTQSFNYFDLRLYAEAVGVPTSILYIFTHVVGDIARDGSRDNAINLLESSIAAIKALEAYITAADPNGDPDELRKAFMIFHGDDPDSPTYDTKLDGLRKAMEAFREERGVRYHRDDGLVG